MCICVCVCLPLPSDKLVFTGKLLAIWDGTLLMIERHYEGERETWENQTLGSTTLYGYNQDL